MHFPPYHHFTRSRSWTQGLKGFLSLLADVEAGVELLEDQWLSLEELEMQMEQRWEQEAARVPVIASTTPVPTASLAAPPPWAVLPQDQPEPARLDTFKPENLLSAQEYLMVLAQIDPTLSRFGDEKLLKGSEVYCRKTQRSAIPISETHMQSMACVVLTRTQLGCIGGYELAIMIQMSFHTTFSLPF